MKRYLIYFLLFNLSCSSLPTSKKNKKVKEWQARPMSEQIKPFVSDGCSMFPEGSKSNKTKWLHCCIKHDLAYWKGGAEKEKKKADKQLGSCVQQADEKLISKMMEAGTAVGGSPRFKTNFKWGFGWNYNRGFIPLTTKELTYIISISPRPGDNLLDYLDKELIDPDIKKLKPITL